MENSKIKKLYLLKDIPIILFTPIYIYIIFEYITGNVLNITGINMVLNLVFLYIFYINLFFITNSIRFSYISLNICFLLLAIAEYFVTEFRGRPLMLADFLAFQTGFSVASEYHFTLNLRLIIGIIATILLIILTFFIKQGFKNIRLRILCPILSLILTGFFIHTFYKKILSKYELSINMWNPMQSYTTSGYILSTMALLELMQLEAPPEYTLNKVDEIATKIQNEKKEIPLPYTPEHNIVPTNIIIIMNESYTNLKSIADFQTNIDYFETYNSLDKNVIKGDLYTSVYGAMTSVTEFEFLTSNSNSFTPKGSVAYQLYMRNPTFSLVSTLESQGYQTIAMHPYPAQNWNRDNAYSAMGFDIFYDLDYFSEAKTLREYVSDQANFEEIIKLTQQKEKNSPLFIFNVTMQNHGGYEDKSYLPEVRLLNIDSMNKTEQYLSLIRETDIALKNLLDYYRSIEEPTLIVMFGDHQPHLETEFYEYLYGKKLSDLTTEEDLRRYITPFFIWTNYDSPTQYIDKTTPQYLSNIILQRANLPLTDYQYFVEKVNQSIPVIQAFGYYRTDNSWVNWSDWESEPEYELLLEYWTLLHNNMFESLLHRRNQIFTLPQIQ